ncbi:Pyrophosphatase PpaX [Paenibacillus solanacearum]|uniref:Pyrophosphatase PpaX n=1 Tax=Paenibacillus solanacearum TaxID=2048548 RepID=A0A916NS82_9BACL|nr:HAD-IA family hydrolase [Paenibacillus solanacearum]CAG7648016.1 Pyrophosphatase PpaX [Paenibacillus solanacearum]
MTSAKHELGNVTTLLFDLDGTLLDSHEFLMKTQFQTLEKHYPGVYTYEQVVSNFGTIFLDLVKAIDAAGYRTAVDEFIAAKVSGYRHNTQLFSGVLAGLRRLKEGGYKLGIVTNQHKDAVINLMRDSELGGLFETVIALEDMTQEKPAPEGILKALRQLGSVPSEAVMIGDSKADIWAAKNAATTSVLLKWYGEKDTSAYPPDIEYDSLEGFIEELTSAQRNRSA